MVLSFYIDVDTFYDDNNDNNDVLVQYHTIQKYIKGNDNNRYALVFK